MKTRAALLTKQGIEGPYAKTRPIEIAEITLDPPGPEEVLVKVTAAALCHTDLSFMTGDRPKDMPMVLGHEACGEVLETGPGVRDLAPGDQVIFSFVPRCGHCPECTDGRPVLCEEGTRANGAGTLLSGARRMKYKGHDVHHQAGLSAFSEMVVVSRHSLIPVAEKVTPKFAALFGCAILTGGGAVNRAAGVRVGSTVAVLGLGGVGLSAVMMAKAAGAREIVAIDVNEAKLAQALELGATATFNARSESCVQDVLDHTRGGLNYALEMAGAPGVMEMAYAVTRRGGTTVTASLARNDTIWNLPPITLVAGERTVKGSYFGSSIPTLDVPRYLDLFRQGRLPVEKLLSGTLKLDQINEGFDRLAEGSVVRQVIEFD
ncbi:zinc-dependent alcohol dehydrogenase family protein [Martelella radicis]|uniref:zinc-dependent alcohol dehydrogenase family protein n=1 Tax=Martelella radicis TaxID=1397476 RepID=UPI001621952C|nr:zinc-dependent alcohol dehydrogenase family protein [Martelella radicis]